MWCEMVSEFYANITEFVKNYLDYICSSERHFDHTTNYLAKFLNVLFVANPEFPYPKDQAPSRETIGNLFRTVPWTP